MVFQDALQSWASTEETFQSSLTRRFVSTSILLFTLYLFRFFFYLCQKSPYPKDQDHDAPPQLVLPIKKIAQSFFETPFDFLTGGFKATSSSIFRFRLFKHEVTAISGTAARDVFFQEKGLNLYEGFQALIGNVCYTV
jgi:hypothetical protein